MPMDVFEALRGQISSVRPSHAVGYVTSISSDMIEVSGLGHAAGVGDTVRFETGLTGDVLQVFDSQISVAPDGPITEVRIGAQTTLLGPRRIAPNWNWVGRVLDPDGQPLDGLPLTSNGIARSLKSAPPDAVFRRGLGPKLATGNSALDTVLPIARGQRVGLFAGSGVGKSRLLADLAKKMEADIVVIGLIGERGRELRDFVQDTLGPEGMARSVVIAATSDRSAAMRARAAYSTMAVAEFFRDQGAQVLLLVDSITRFAEAEAAMASAGHEGMSGHGYPASTMANLMALCERAGPGLEKGGDITAVFSVLVAGSDMEGVLADTLRGVLDGHIVLDRDIAERGRFPAINLLRSVSRSLPKAATKEENDIIKTTRTLLGAFDRVEMMVQAGLYAEGSDPLADRAVALWPELDALWSEPSEDCADAFSKLRAILSPDPS